MDQMLDFSHMRLAAAAAVSVSTCSSFIQETRVWNDCRLRLLVRYFLSPFLQLGWKGQSLHRYNEKLVILKMLARCATDARPTMNISSLGWFQHKGGGITDYEWYQL